MSPPDSIPGRRRGFSLLEVQAAFIVLGFSMAAMFPFAVAQLKLVSALERRLPPNTTFVLVSRDNHLLNVLAAGSGTSTPTNVASATQGPSTEGFGAAKRVLIVDSVTPGSGTNEVTTVVTIQPSSTGGGG